MTKRGDKKKQEGSKKNHASKKYKLDNKAYIGGILIRQLVTIDGSEVLDGPWACAELFRNFMDKEYGYVRKGNLLHDDEINVSAS